MTDRLNSYKNRGKADEVRKRIKNETIEIRKAKKFEQINKRRVFNDDEELDDETHDNFKAERDLNFQPQDIPDIQSIIAGLNSGDSTRILEATRLSRKMLSKEVNPPIDIFIKAGLVPRFVNLLTAESSVLQFEAAWALTNVASGSEPQTRVAVESGACEYFMKLLKEASPNVVEQVIWGLSNIAGTGPEYRNQLLKMGLLSNIIDLVKTTQSPTLLATSAWCLSNLCRKMGVLPDFHAVLPAVPVIAKLLEHDNIAVVSDACWALSYFTDGPNERIEAACQAGVVPHLVSLLGNCSEKVIIIPALRVLGNIVTGNDVQTQSVIDQGTLKAMKPLFQEPGLKKEVIWALSNILAGNPKQIQSVIDEGFIEPLVEMLNNGDYKCRVEATWAVSNLTCGGNPDQIACLVRAGALGPLASMLGCSDVRIVRITLDAFWNMLRPCQDLDSLQPLLMKLEEIGFVDQVEQLQMHENEAVYRRAAAMIAAFFPQPEETDDIKPLEFQPIEVYEKFTI